MIGAILTAVFASERFGGWGVPSGIGIWQQLGLQCLAVGVAAAWSGVVSLALLGVLQRTIGIRVTPDQETDGLDVALNNGKAYHL